MSTNLISAGEPGEGSDDESTGDSANVVADLAVDNSDAMLAGQVELSDDVAPNDPSENAGSGAPSVALSRSPAPADAGAIYDRLPESMIGGGYRNISALLGPGGEDDQAPQQPVAAEAARQIFSSEDGKLFWAKPGEAPGGARAVLFYRQTENVLHLGPPLDQHRSSSVPPADIAGAEEAEANPHNIYSDVGLGQYDASPANEAGGYDSISGSLEAEQNQYDRPPKPEPGGYDEAPKRIAQNVKRRPRLRDNPNRRAMKFENVSEKKLSDKADVKLQDYAIQWESNAIKRQASVARIALLDAIIQRRQPPPSGGIAGGWRAQR